MQRSLINSAPTLADSYPSTNRETVPSRSVDSQLPRVLNTSTYLGMNEHVVPIKAAVNTQPSGTDLDRVEQPAWDITRGSAFGAAGASDVGSHGAPTLHPLDKDDYIFSKNNADNSSSRDDKKPGRRSSATSSDHGQVTSSPSPGTNDRASMDPNSKELPSASLQGSSAHSSSFALGVTQRPEHQRQTGSKYSDTSEAANALSGDASMQDGELTAVSAIIDAAFRSLNSGLETPVSTDVPDTASTGDRLTAKIPNHANIADRESSWQGHQGDSSQPSSEHLAVSPLRFPGGEQRSSKSQVSDISQEDEESSNLIPKDNHEEPRASDSDPLTLHASDTSTLEQHAQITDKTPPEYRTSSEDEVEVDESNSPEDIEKFGQQIIQENHPPPSQFPPIQVTENGQAEDPDEPPPPFTSIESNFPDETRERSPPYTPSPASRLSEVDPIREVQPGHLSLQTQPPQAPPMHQIVEHLPTAPNNAFQDPTVPRRFYSLKPSVPPTGPASTNGNYQGHQIQTSPGANSRPMQLQREQSHQRNYNPTIPSHPVHARSQSKGPPAAWDVQDSQHPAFRTNQLRPSSPIRWGERPRDTVKSRTEGQGLAANRSNILNSLSRPDTDSLGSRESTKVHTGTSHSDLQFEQSPVNPFAPSTPAEEQSPRGKLKRIGRFHRFSSSSIPTASAENTRSETSRSEGAKKKSAFSRLSVYCPYTIFLI